MPSPFDTSETVASLRPICQQWSDPAAAKAGQFNPTQAPNFIPYLNEVCYRINDEGLWKGIMGEVVFNGAPLGYITLPRRYESLQGAAYGNFPTNFFSQYNQYKDMGLGPRNPKQYGQMGFTDMGDGWCIQQDLDDQTPSYLTIKITNPADAGNIIRLYGENNTLDPSQIYDASGDSNTGSEGIAVTTIYPSVTTTIAFTALQRIIAGTSASPFKYPWTLWSVINGTLTQIGAYEPGEMNPQYRRWKTGVLSPSTTGNGNCQAIRFLCKRRVIDLIYENDLVFPGVRYAISLGMQSLRYEKVSGDIQKAIAYWQDAIRVLNNNIKNYRGKQQLSVPFRMGYPALPEQTF